MSDMHIVSVNMSGDLLETLDARRGGMSRSGFIRQILEEAIERGVRFRLLEASEK